MTVVHESTKWMVNFLEHANEESGCHKLDHTYHILDFYLCFSLTRFYIFYILILLLLDVRQICVAQYWLIQMSNHQLFNENSHIAYIILDILNQPTIKRYSWYVCMTLLQRSNILYFVGPNVFMFIQVTVLNFHIFRETHLQCITTM